MQELVSAVIPTFNYGKFVGRAVDSILAQSYGSIECIVVDDGSTDDTAQVLSRYADRVQVIRQSNRGISAARNVGIRAARGEFVALLDADDWWHEDKIARQVSFLREHVDIGCVGCGRRHVQADGSTYNDIHGACGGTDHLETFRNLTVRKFWIGGSGSGALIRRSILESVGAFDESLTAAEDWDLWLRLAQKTRLDNVSDVLTYVSRHGTGSFRNAAKMEAAQWVVYEKVAASAFGRCLSAADYRKIRALIYVDRAGEHIAAGDSASAVRYYAYSIAAWPFERRRWAACAKIAIKQIMGRDAFSERRPFVAES